MNATASPLHTAPLEPEALDDELGIELLDDMVEEDFWDGFVVGASLGAAAAGGAIAIGIAT